MSTTTLVLVAWPFVAALLGLTLRARQALLAAWLVGWLLLPIATIDLPFVDYDKYAATSLGALACAFAADLRAKRRVPLHWVDLPMLVWCVAPAFSSWANDLGAWDMLSAAATRSLAWGVPWIFGRRHFADREGLEQCARALFLAGLAYAPLCVWEIRMSPQLHRLAYGYHQHAFEQTIRMGGLYRPMVFLHHGLMLSLFLAAAGLAGHALWRAGKLKPILGLRPGWCVAFVVLTCLACQSYAAAALLCFGLLLQLAPPRRRELLVGCLLLVPPLYALARAGDLWQGQPVVALVEQLNTERAESLQYRIDHERLLSAHAWKRPLFGWGGWDRMFPPSEDESVPFVVSDSLWVIAFGQNGLLGLAAMLALGLVPVLVWTRRCSPRLWSAPEAAAGGALALVLALWVVDGMVNAMIVPFYVLVAGALAGSVELPALRPARARVARIAAGRAAPRAVGATRAEPDPDGGAAPEALGAGAS